MGVDIFSVLPEDVLTLDVAEIARNAQSAKHLCEMRLVSKTTSALFEPRLFCFNNNRLLSGVHG